MNKEQLKKDGEPRLFYVVRKADESGVSGTGRVLDGVVYHNGKVAICWRTENKHGYTSVAVYDSFEAFKFIHIDSHPANDTEIVWNEPHLISSDEIKREAYKYGIWYAVYNYVEKAWEDGYLNGFKGMDLINMRRDFIAKVEEDIETLTQSKEGGE